MMRFLGWFNLLGVLAIAGLCAAQWRTNWQLHLRTLDLQKQGIEQDRIIQQRDKLIAGDAADLEDFRHRLTLSESQLNSLNDQVHAMRREWDALVLERDRLAYDTDRLKSSLDAWMAAVKARDVELKRAGEEAQALAKDRNSAVAKFNALAGQYNDLMKLQSARGPTTGPGGKPGR